MVKQISIIKLIIAFNAALLCRMTPAQPISIGLFPDRKIESVAFSVVAGTYNLKLDEKLVQALSPGAQFFVRTTPEGTMLISDNNQVFSFQQLQLLSTSEKGEFQFKPLATNCYSADYDDHLILISEFGKLKAINHVDINKYTAGVAEAEGGPGAPYEYYKAQAILIRTYAHINRHRHTSEGYSLCNLEHCQAYKGRSLMNKHIHAAVEETAGLILTDTSGIPIVTPYHSNCGGQTATAEIVWQQPLPCLYGIRDPFCTGSRNATWTKQVTLPQWERYLKNNLGNKILDGSAIQPFQTSYRQRDYHVEQEGLITFRKIREDFGLKSAFFDINIQGNQVIFKGKGFGHGVGLCQEGAMEMARVGYGYEDILHFYFQLMKIVTISAR